MGTAQGTDMLEVFLTQHRLEAGDTGSKSIQAGCDILIATVDLLNIIDRAGTLCTHRCDEQGDTCADVREVIFVARSWCD